MAHLLALRESIHHVFQRVRDRLPLRCDDWRGMIPTQCPLCSGAACGGALCERCHALIACSRDRAVSRCERCCLAFEHSGQCPQCATHTPAFDRIIAAFDYWPPADYLIHRLKVARRFTDASMLGAMLANEVMRVWPDLPEDLILVAVPASAQAIRRRGFNPAAEVARVLARRLNRPYRPELLRRVRDGSKQATLSRERRMIGTSRLYQVTASMQGARVAVVDDVVTTGSTLNRIATIFKHSGAVSVHGLALARTPRVLASPL